MALKFLVLLCVGLVALGCDYECAHSANRVQPPSVARPQEPPPTPRPTPVEDAARYIAWLEKQGKPLSDMAHEDVSLRIGDWGFFYHGERPVGSWQPLQGRSALDHSGHAVTEAQDSDWFAFLSVADLDAASALKRVAWLFNADGLVPNTEPRVAKRDRFTAPTLTTKDGVITFQGWCEAHSDPPYEMHITIGTSAESTVLINERAKR